MINLRFRPRLRENGVAFRMFNDLMVLEIRSAEVIARDEADSCGFVSLPFATSARLLSPFRMCDARLLIDSFRHTTGSFSESESRIQLISRSFPGSNA